MKDARTRKKLCSLLSVIILAYVMSSCSGSDPKELNEKNLIPAVEKYLAKDINSEICLGEGVSLRRFRFPVSIDSSSQYNNDTVLAQYKTLETTGAIKSTRKEEDILDYWGKKPTGKKKIITTYDLVDNEQNNLAQESKGRLCFGRKKLKKITNWLEGAFGSKSFVEVKYTYIIDNLAEWAKNPNILKAFPEVKKVIDGQGKIEDKVPVLLTGKGWIPARDF